MYTRDHTGPTDTDTVERKAYDTKGKAHKRRRGGISRTGSEKRAPRARSAQRARRIRQAAKRKRQAEKKEKRNA